MAENAVKSDNYFFRNIFAVDENGNVKDILEDGSLSCAVFVSQILFALELIKKPHATVSGTIKDMEASGWTEIKELRTGAVILWEKINEHAHIGFCISDSEAISNFTTERFPRKHHITYNNTRKIEKIYWHPELDNS